MAPELDVGAPPGRFMYTTDGRVYATGGRRDSSELGRAPDTPYSGSKVVCRPPPWTLNPTCTTPATARTNGGEGWKGAHAMSQCA